MSEVWEGESHTASNMGREAQPHKKSENENKTTIKYHLTCTRLAKWESQKIPSAGGEMRTSYAFLVGVSTDYFRDHPGCI